MLTEKRFAAEAVSINYVEGPPGGRPVVMLHGVTNRWQTFLPVLPLLGWRYHTYALDMRGHGRSGWAQDGYQSGQFAQDVIQFLQAMIAEPAVLIGHSLGAMVAIQVAARASDLIEAVVLEDPPFAAAADGETPPPPWFQEYHDLMTSTGSRDEKLTGLAILTPDADGPALQAQFKALEQVDPALLIAGQEDHVLVDLTLAEVLPKIGCPLLLIQGNPALEGVIQHEEARRALALLSQATHFYAAEVGHSLHAPQPHTFFTVVSNFIEGLE